MVLVIVVLAIAGTLATTVLLQAMGASDSTNHESAATRALAAANAGLHAATYRLSSVGAANAECFTTTGVAPSGGACPTWSDSTGNGASYTYEVGPALTASDPCAGTWVQSVASTVQRCITSIGTAAGVQRRVQQRVIAHAVDTSFPVNGVFSRTTLQMSGSADVTGDLAANGDISLSGSAAVDGTVSYVPPATFSGACASPGCTLVARPSPFSAGGVDAQAFANAAASNDNAAIAWPSGVYTAATREVSSSSPVGSAGSPVDLPTGVYSFCRVAFSQSVNLRVPDGDRVTIYLDSPDRPGSSCPSGTGDLTVSGPFTLLNPSGEAANLQVFAYGDPGGTLRPFTFSQTVNSAGSPLTALIHAPNSRFASSNVAHFKGGLVAGQIQTSNSFTFAGDVGTAQQTSISPRYFPTGWRTCGRAAPSGPGLGAGC